MDSDQAYIFRGPRLGGDRRGLGVHVFTETRLRSCRCHRKAGCGGAIEPGKAVAAVHGSVGT